MPATRAPVDQPAPSWALLRPHQSIDAVFEIVQAHSRGLRFYAPEKLRVTRLQVNHKAEITAGAKQRMHVAVKVRDVQCTGPFEHIVDVLRDEPNRILPPGVLPRRENRAYFVRARIPLLRDSLVIETEDRLPVLPPVQEVTDLVEVLLGPNAVSGMERRNPAFC